MVLSFLNGKRKFNYRVAGIIIRNNHVLVCREDDQDYVFLPGGRVEFGEASDGALRREIEEELGCEGEIGQLVFSVENFFDLEGERYHELAKYYRVKLLDDFPFETQKPCRIAQDEGHELKFYWIEIDEQALKAINLLPQWIRGRFDNLPEHPQHLIIDEIKT
ncbi:hypothetical protein MNBD_ALPHA11-1136 [hydrothermal vent metagenome]|uniref:Nudix hydrolase domain-containing protein n=1 Tax=hydrothermal vent metagenome TaxID=652676 RepID=A0A3B0U3W0_9ZZZZ